jgi:hypothetical protein
MVLSAAAASVGCASEDDGTLTTRYETSVAQTTWDERGDIHTVLVDSSTKSQLATMDWSRAQRRIAWNVDHRFVGDEPMAEAPNVGDMNRAIHDLHHAAWMDSAGAVRPTF